MEPDQEAHRNLKRTRNEARLDDFPILSPPRLPELVQVHGEPSRTPTTRKKFDLFKDKLKTLEAAQDAESDGYFSDATVCKR